MNKIILLVISFTLLSSCGGGGSNNDDPTSPLIGVWITESCDIQFENIWIKGIYEFTSSGEINYERKAYEDSNCITLIDPSRYIYGFPYTATYQDLGEQTLIEGIAGNNIAIEITDITNNKTSANGYYTIRNNTLCLSSYFIFNSSGYSVNEAGVENIDFGTCIVKEI